MTTQDTSPISVSSLILASNSPRRKELLAGLGLRFDVMSPTVDEKAIADPSLSPPEYVMALARAKGESIASRYPNALVISADTVVVLNGQFLEKPVDIDDAARMLSELQGTTHEVVTGIGVFCQGKALIRSRTTRVRISALSDYEIASYIATGEPMDKAGAYAIQGIGGSFVEHIEGCYSNVVGLSLPLLREMLLALEQPELLPY